MNQKPFTFKQMTSVTDTASGLSEHIPLVRERHFYPEIILTVDIINYGVGEMMDIDHQIINTCRLQF